MTTIDLQAIEDHVRSRKRPPFDTPEHAFDDEGNEIDPGAIGDCCAYLVHFDPAPAEVELLGAKPYDKLFVAVIIADDATPGYAQALTAAVQDAVLAGFQRECGVLLLDEIPREEHGDNLRAWLADIT